MMAEAAALDSNPSRFFDARITRIASIDAE
jgi:hypothetical protein